MSQCSDIPQSPLAKAALGSAKSAELPAKDAASLSPSSSSSPGDDDTGGRAYSTFKEASALHGENGALSSSNIEGGTLAPPYYSLAADLDGNHNSSSPFLQPVDLRSLSTSPLPCQDANQPYLKSLLPTGYPTLVETPGLVTRTSRFWHRNRSCMLIAISSFFGATMTAAVKSLQDGEHAMDPFQIILFRMIFTMVVCLGWMYLQGVPDMLFGPKDLKWLLVLRAVSGFVGLIGIWQSVNYLDLADATVITFLTPSMAAVMAYLFMKQPFTCKDMAASLIAMVGVVFIARPAALFGRPDAEDNSPVAGTTTDRIWGVCFAVMSATGGAVSLVAIKKMGERVDVLLTTNYFAVLCAVVSAIALGAAPLIGYDQPNMRFRMPRSSAQWQLLANITICGFATQYFLTAGMRTESRSNKAPAMIYTGIVWTMLYDWWVFGAELYWTSVLGGTLVIGSAVWLVLQRKPDEAAPTAGDVEGGAMGTELGYMPVEEGRRSEDADSPELLVCKAEAGD